VLEDDVGGWGGVFEGGEFDLEGFEALEGASSGPEALKALPDIRGEAPGMGCEACPNVVLFDPELCAPENRGLKVVPGGGKVVGCGVLDAELEVDDGVCGRVDLVVHGAIEDVEWGSVLEEHEALYAGSVKDGEGRRDEADGGEFAVGG